MTKIRGKSRKYTDPAYYEANRIETGLNHVDYGKFTYSHISKEEWEAVFGQKDDCTYKLGDEEGFESGGREDSKAETSRAGR